MTMDERITALEKEVTALKLALEERSGKQINSQDVEQMVISALESNRCCFREVVEQIRKQPSEKQDQSPTKSFLLADELDGYTDLRLK